MRIARLPRSVSSANGMRVTARDAGARERRGDKVLELLRRAATGAEQRQAPNVSAHDLVARRRRAQTVELVRRPPRQPLRRGDDAIPQRRSQTRALDATSTALRQSVIVEGARHERDVQQVPCAEELVHGVRRDDEKLPRGAGAGSARPATVTSSGAARRPGTSVSPNPGRT